MMISLTFWRYADSAGEMSRGDCLELEVKVKGFMVEGGMYVDPKWVTDPAFLGGHNTGSDHPKPAAPGPSELTNN